MAKKKTTYKKNPLFTREFQNIVAGGILVMLAILVLFSTKDTTTSGNMPIIGRYLSEMGVFLFGEQYRLIFSPIVGILGIMILIKKAEWTLWRCVGLVLYWIALTSLMGWYYKSPVGFFDVFHSLETMLGGSSTIIFLIVLLLTSLYLTLRISYREIFSKVRQSVPSMSAIRSAKETFLPSEDIADLMPKKGKLDRDQQKKAEAIEERLASIQKHKEPETKVIPPGRAILNNLMRK